MMSAEVGDDVFGEDPTVNALEARVARMCGMEAAVFNCSGTQSNQMALRAHCHPGDEIIIEETSHIVNYEQGAPAALSGISARTVRGDGGLIIPADLDGKVRKYDQHFPISKLICIENTTNHGGGRVYSLDRMRQISDWARSQKLKVHVDGARIFNATIAAGYSLLEFCQLADSISICFSKGLGCPMGAILVSNAETIHRARRARKLFGGGLRQSGIIAAGCLYALDHHVDRLANDHLAARRFAETLAQSPHVRIHLPDVETNLVFFEMDPKWGTSEELSKALRERGVRMNPSGKFRMRAVAHLDVTEQQAIEAAHIVADTLARPRPIA